MYTPDIQSCRRLSLSANSRSIEGILTKKREIESGELKIIQTGESTSGYILSYQPDEKIISISHFHVLQRLDGQGKVLVQFTPLTGKKHQLRLHAAFFLGAPVVGDHRYGYPQNDGVLSSTRIEDEVYKDGYALHCYRIASTNSVKFDFVAALPNGRWGDVWNRVRSDTVSDGFNDRIRDNSKHASRVFLRDDVQKFLKNMY